MKIGITTHAVSPFMSAKKQKQKQGLLIVFFSFNPFTKVFHHSFASQTSCNKESEIVYWIPSTINY